MLNNKKITFRIRISFSKFEFVGEMSIYFDVPPNVA